MRRIVYVEWVCRWCDIDETEPPAWESMNMALKICRVLTVMKGRKKTALTEEIFHEIENAMLRRPV